MSTNMKLAKLMFGILTLVLLILLNYSYFPQPITPIPQAHAAGTTYYVRTDGNNVNNNGLTNSSGGAWKTITYAGQHVTAGDTIRVQAGTYVETTSGIVSGTSGNTVTLVADGTVTTCGMSFSSKSYIRVIGFTMDPATTGCSTTGQVVSSSGTNTGLEFWNDVIGSNVNGKGYNLSGFSGACNSCIVMGGSINNIGGSVSDTSLMLTGNDDYVGYVVFSTICYLGVGPSGVRQRFINLDFSGFVQCGGAHPDFFYPNIQSTSSAAFSNAVIESFFGIGTTTSTDNKAFHAENQWATAWNDNVWRFNVAYNLGSQFFSMYDSTGGVNRWRFYNNSIVNCMRANSGQNYCGTISHTNGGMSPSIYNTLFQQAWSDNSTSGIQPYSPLGSPTITADYNLAFDPDGAVTFASPWTLQVHKQSNVNPQLTNVAGQDFTLQSTSGARGTGGPLTTATSCSGSTLNVAANTGSFFIGSNSSNLPQYGGNLVPGDFITVGSTSYQVASVSGDALTLTSSITCSSSDPVYYGKSNTIDIGAYPYKPGGYNLTATYAVSGSTATITPNDPSLVRFAVCYNDNVPTAVVNSSPYSCSTGSGTFSAKVYPKYASQTLSAAATLSGGSPNPPPPPTPIPGDINLDHIVNSIDYSILNSDWFTSASRSDLNTDGIVNAIDYSILNSNWFKTW